MNIHDPDQVNPVTSLISEQYPDLLDAFQDVLHELQATRTEVSLSELKQLARERTEPYRTEMMAAITASEEGVLVSDLIVDETESTN